MKAQAPLLRPGERARLVPDGPIFIVQRVTPCGAYVKGGESRTVTIGERSFVASAGDAFPISARAFVYRVDDGKEA